MDATTASSGGKKSNTLRNLIIIVILLLIIGGIAAYFVNKHSSSDKNNSTTVSSSGSASTKSNSFAPAVNANVPYTATISATSDGKQTTATMVSDGKGSFSYSYQTDGKTATAIYTPDAYYLCSDSSTCFKYSSSKSASSSFDPSTYQYDSTKIDGLKNTAAYKGQQSCPVGGGSCDVWSVSENGGTTTLFVNTSSKRIVKASYISGTTSNEITYDYKSVSVAVPTNATTVPGQ